MNARRRFLVNMSVLGLGCHLTSEAQASRSSVPVQGQLWSAARNGPVPGMTVYLVHQILGRSAASLSDAFGRFGWNAIPARPDPYFLEAYWGQDLVYRNPVIVSAAVTLPVILL